MRHDAHLIRLDTGEELLLPVPPEVYELEDSVDYASEYVQEVGEVRFPGLPMPSQITLGPLLLPTKEYPFANSVMDDPHGMVDQLAEAMRNRTLFRYIEGNSSVNRRVFISSLSRREQDGTDDVYLTIVLHEAPDLRTPELRPNGAGAALGAREDDWIRTEHNVYVAQEGDTWWRIADVWYHNGALGDALAAYNGAANSVLLPPGTVIDLLPTASLQPTDTHYSADMGYTGALDSALNTLSGDAETAAAESAEDRTERYAQWLQLHNDGLTPLSWRDWYEEMN